MAKPKQGTQNGDTIFDTSGNDRLIGHNGDDFFFVSGGVDTINGQNGFDTAVFSGAFADFSIVTDNTGNLRTRIAGSGVDAELKHVERVLFDNGVYDIATGQFTANTVAISGEASVGEGGSLTYVVTRTGDLSRSLDVALATGGSATGTDFAGALPAGVTFAAGQDTVTITLGTLDDGVYEGDETFTLALVADADRFVFGASSQSTASIVDAQTPPPPLPVLRISNATISEGGALVFRVSIDAPVAHAISFDARTDTGTHAVSPSDPTLVNFGTATAGNLPNGDYNGFPATQYIIPAGQTWVDIPVTTRQDLLAEGNETMSLRLSNASGATIVSGVGFGRGVGTIVDVPPTPVTHVSYYADANNVTEGGDLVFYFYRDVATSDLDLHFWMNTFPGGGATPGVDFTADGVAFTYVPADANSNDFMLGQDHWSDPSMVVHFEAGQTVAQLVVHVTDDGIAEPFGEAFALHLDFAANGQYVQYDGAMSQQLYLAAYPFANATQVNIGHIVDPL